MLTSVLCWMQPSMHYWNACEEESDQKVKEILEKVYADENYVFKVHFLAGILLGACNIVSTLQELGQSVWMCAAKHGHISVVKDLVKAGAELDFQDTEVPYQKACYYYNYVCMCLQNGCTALTVATQASQVDIVESLLDSGADLNIQEKVLCINNTYRWFHYKCINLSSPSAAQHVSSADCYCSRKPAHC